jgi:hypothetical protein
MPKLLYQLFFSGRRYFQLSLVSLLLFAAIGETEARPSKNQELQASTTRQAVLPTKTFDKDRITIGKGKLPNKDGIYLYGQSPQPSQIGQEYLVFEMRQGQVMGAFYLPHSEFNCFQGSLKSGNLALKIASSPDSTTYSDPIADRSPQIATTSETSYIGEAYQQIESPYSVALQSYYQLSSISESDRQILAACKNNYQQ